jgi:hypothetical protein
MANLSLAELESFDPHARKSGAERRFCCPLCNDGRKLSPDHRSLALDTRTGAWLCHRCKEKGLLIDNQTVRNGTPSARQKPRVYTMPGSITAAAPAPKPVQAPEGIEQYKAIMESCTEIQGTPAETYLAGRGIVLDPGAAYDVGYSPNCYGSEMIIFYLLGADGQRVGAQGRGIKSKTFRIAKDPAADQTGQIFATPGAMGALSWMVIVEAPIDALSLAVCGVSAIATIGTNFPDWLAREMVFCPVFLGYDNDQAGDDGVRAAAASLERFGATPYRLRPPEGCKDWNEALQDLGREELQDYLSKWFPTLKAANPPELPVQSPTPEVADPRDSEDLIEPRPPANRILEAQILEYTADMGELHFDHAQDVIIAGKIRRNLAWVRPDMIEMYQRADRTTKDGFNVR